MRVPVAPPSSVSAWTPKKKQPKDDDDDATVPARKKNFKEAIKAEEPATVPAWKQRGGSAQGSTPAKPTLSTAPSWKQKNTRSNISPPKPRDSGSEADGAATRNGGGDKTVPAWKQKLKGSTRPAVAPGKPALSTAPSWKQKHNGTKVSPTEAEQSGGNDAGSSRPASKSNVSSKDMAVSNEEKAVPAWKPKLKGSSVAAAPAKPTLTTAPSWKQRNNRSISPPKPRDTGAKVTSDGPSNPSNESKAVPAWKQKLKGGENTEAPSTMAPSLLTAPSWKQKNRPTSPIKPREDENNDGSTVAGNHTEKAVPAWKQKVKGTTTEAPAKPSLTTAPSWKQKNSRTTSPVKPRVDGNDAGTKEAGKHAEKAVPSWKQKLKGATTGAPVKHSLTTAPSWKQKDSRPTSPARSQGNGNDAGAKPSGNEKPVPAWKQKVKGATTETPAKPSLTPAPSLKKKVNGSAVPLQSQAGAKDAGTAVASNSTSSSHSAKSLPAWRETSSSHSVKSLPAWREKLKGRGANAAPVMPSNPPRDKPAASPVPSWKQKSASSPAEANTTGARGWKSSAAGPNSSSSSHSKEKAVDMLLKNTTTSLTQKTVDDPNSTRIMVLVSTMSGSRRQLSRQERSIAMLEALGIPFETMNCAMQEFTNQRDNYFEISGVQGDYPQFFLITGGTKEAAYLGQFDDMQACNEKSNLPKESIKDSDATWDSIMGTTNKYNHKGYNAEEAVDENDDDSIGSGAGGIYANL
ncbi:expressed unknown protein [Seminavis robusta]|uniref:Glutaredoxin domain-containing protein n=1 Tax=Seminavis robusta TaxID=568900 RepID=A0A9N8DQA7_9STRA|nr:expressed unknown protein [Seminavis robusta]|eukprot:Sro208_g087030.1 n/a (743) ;mRNA; f:25648-27876